MNISDLLIAAAAAHFMNFLDTGSMQHIPESVLIAGTFLADQGLCIGEDGVRPMSPEDINANKAFFAAFLLGGAQQRGAAWAR